MLSKNNNFENFKNRTLSSTGNLKNLYKLKNSAVGQSLARTASAINLPRMKFNHDSNDSLSFNSTGFSFKSKKLIESAKLKKFNSLLNIHSMEDFLGKTKDPLEKQKELYENMKEEKLKIKNVLSNLISWDNEPTLKEIESFKMIHLEDENLKISKEIKNFEKTANYKLQQKMKDNKIIGEALKLMRNKVPVQIMKEMNISKGTKIKEKNMQLMQLKFSVFDKDYDPKKYKPVVKKEKDKKKEEEEKINKFKEKDYLVQFQKQQRQIEMIRRDEIAIIYKNIIINKLKKKNSLKC